MDAPNAKPNPDEMQAALAAIGVEWDTDWQDPAFNTWSVTGLENGGESAESCEAAIRRMMDASEHDGRREERESIAEWLPGVLADHWVTSIVCDHDAKTDVAVCFCMWTSEALPSVGEAVLAWAEHVAETMQESGGDDDA